MILEVADNWRSVFPKNILKKDRFWTLIFFCYGNICNPYNTWVAGVYMAYIFDRNSWRKPSQIEWLFELNLKSFSYFECSTALWILLEPAAKAACLKELAGCFRPSFPTDAQIRAFAKNENYIQIVDTTLDVPLFSFKSAICSKFTASSLLIPVKIQQ